RKSARPYRDEGRVIGSTPRGDVSTYGKYGLPRLGPSEIVPQQCDANPNRTEDTPGPVDPARLGPTPATRPGDQPDEQDSPSDIRPEQYQGEFPDHVPIAQLREDGGTHRHEVGGDEDPEADKLPREHEDRRDTGQESRLAPQVPPRRMRGLEPQQENGRSPAEP